MQKVRLFDQKIRIYVESYVYIQILESMGLHGSQTIKELIFLKNKVVIRSWGYLAICRPLEGPA